jgi:hypothetical protein
MASHFHASGVHVRVTLDYRDLPFVWDKGFYKMDVEKLRSAMSNAKLVLGDVKKTIPSFMTDPAIAPLGFISFDLDYYSSTKDALRLFDAPQRKWLPRVYCYFDDLLWPETSCYNEHIGELCAIRECNESHAGMALAPIHLLQYMRVFPEVWNEQIYVLHEFHHPLYCRNITPKQEKYTQLPL